MLKQTILAGGLALAAGAAQATTIDADLMFVIDQSGSMSAEFTNLGAGIDSFVNNLEADSRIGSVRVGLVRYTLTPELSIDLTDDLSVFAGLTRNSGSGIENALAAIDFAVTDPNISYRDNAVKSVILITDENADDDDPGEYSNSFGEGPSALASLLDSEGFLNNIIYDFGDGDETYELIARPNGALFDIDAFRADPDAFLLAFSNAKLEEIVDAGGDNPAPIPLPAGLPLLLGAMGVLGLVRARRG